MVVADAAVAAAAAILLHPSINRCTASPASNNALTKAKRPAAIVAGRFFVEAASRRFRFPWRTYLSALGVSIGITTFVLFFGSSAIVAFAVAVAQGLR